MAKLEVNIPADKTQLVLDALASNFGYSDQLLNEQNELIPNPMSKGEFAKIQLFRYIRQQVKKYRDTQSSALNTQEAENIDLT